MVGCLLPVVVPWVPATGAAEAVLLAVAGTAGTGAAVQRPSSVAASVGTAASVASAVGSSAAGAFVAGSAWLHHCLNCLMNAVGYLNGEAVHCWENFVMNCLAMKDLAIVLVTLMVEKTPLILSAPPLFFLLAYLPSSAVFSVVLPAIHLLYQLS